jgi:hypothetical protein
MVRKHWTMQQKKDEAMLNAIHVNITRIMLCAEMKCKGAK